MNVAVLERDARRAQSQLIVVDCDIHPTISTMADLHPYLTDRWKEHLKTFGGLVRQSFASTGSYARYNRDGGARLDTRPPTGGPSGSDLPFMQVNHLNPNNIEYGVLQPLRPAAGSFRNQHLGEALTSAINDWQIDTWCGKESRLKGSLMVNREDPQAAINQIKLHVNDPNFAQISVLPHGIEPLGRQRYWPIFEAAEAYNKPIGIHVGGASGWAPTSTGWPSYYVEEHHSKAEAMQSLMVSMVLEGVFERFPKLRVVLIEGGFVWVPSLAWRLDKHWARLKSEVPHLKRLPSEYIRDHFWYTTQPVEEPENPQHLVDAMDWVGWDKILFSTDYPHWDYDDPNFAFKFRMTEEKKLMLYRNNAKTLYGFK